MAAGKEIRTKIKSVENTKKITKAMEMVAASKMRKAQERMRKARPYSEKVRNIACPIRPTRGLSPYAEEALDRAARAIIGAPNGEQEATINGQSFAIGTLAGAGGIPSDFARRVLIWAAGKVPDFDPRRPWRPGELEEKVSRAFDAGLRQPRALRRA